MKILVTGGAGFIGSNFVRRTLEDAYPGLEGADVVVLDALTYSGNLENLAPVADSPRYSFVHGDIRDAELLDRVLPGVDAIVHFAAESHVDRSVRASGIFVETNVLGTQRLLDAALRNATARFVHVSTDEVYGSIAEGSWDETRSLEPNSPYSASKGGVVGMPLPIARDLAAVGVRVNTVAPGLIDTPIYGEGENSEAFKTNLQKGVLFPQRLGFQSELASMVVECITNSYMNAETIRVDGGIRMPPK